MVLDNGKWVQANAAFTGVAGFDGRGGYHGAGGHGGNQYPGQDKKWNVKLGNLGNLWEFIIKWIIGINWSNMTWNELLFTIWGSFHLSDKIIKFALSLALLNISHHISREFR